MENRLMSDHEFQMTVVDTLGRLETKMDKLVGPDGNNGEVSKMKSDIGRHDKYINRIIGVILFISLILIPLAAIAVTMLEKGK
jgi:hypothetical protein